MPIAVSAGLALIVSPLASLGLKLLMQHISVANFMDGINGISGSRGVRPFHPKVAHARVVAAPPERLEKTHGWHG